MKKRNRRILAVHSDTHGGLKIALMNPSTVLYGEDEEGNPIPYQPESTASQKYLWRIYQEHIKKVFEIANGDPLVVLHCGDECNGNKHPDLLVSNRIADQMIIADYNAQPWFEYQNLTAYRQVIGTGAHNFGFGSSGITLTRLLQARNPKVDIKPLYHGLLELDGITFDYAHHGPFPGSRDWLRGNVARFYLRDLMMREIEEGNRPPDVVLRAHYHSPVYEYLEHGGRISELYVLPSYSMLNDHAMQATQSQNQVTHGMLVFEIEDGEIVEKHRLYEKIDIRTKEVLK